MIDRSVILISDIDNIYKKKKKIKIRSIYDFKNYSRIAVSKTPYVTFNLCIVLLTIEYIVQHYRKYSSTDNTST